MFTGKSRLVLSLIAASSLVFAACTDNTVANPLVSAAGTYQLTLFRGTAPPVTDTYAVGSSTLPQGGTVTWTGGNIVLSSNGTFVETNNYTVVSPAGAAPQNSAFVSSGTYTVNGSNFSLSAPQQNGVGARSAAGTIDATTITYQESNGTGLDTFQYKR
jgi:hypothetical protein